MISIKVHNFIIWCDKNSGSQNLGKFKGVERMVSSRIQLDQFVSQGLEVLVTAKDGLLKVLVEPK